MAQSNVVESSMGSDEVLLSLFEQYASNGEAISVDFRKLVEKTPYGDRGTTHLIHTYPAKLLLHIPNFFLANKCLSQPGDTVLDPFCGSGTVLLEAILADRHAVGADANPLARLVAKVKTTPIATNELHKSVRILRDGIKLEGKESLPNVVNIDHWFHPHVKEHLQCILEAIDEELPNETKDFFRVCFSNCVKKVSLADPRLSVPVRLREDQYPEGHEFRQEVEKRLEYLKDVDVAEAFFKIVETNIKRNDELLKRLPIGPQVTNIFSDARDLSLANGERQQDESVQLVITSPPYAGAQKYIRSSSLSLGWLGMCSDQTLRDYERRNIGREHYSKSEYTELCKTGIEPADRLLEEIWEINPLRAHIAANYLIEMKGALLEIERVLCLGGYFVLVIANNQVCGKEFKTKEYIQEIAESLGFKVRLRLIDDIHSRGLMLKRNKTASVITCEWVLVFQK